MSNFIIDCIKGDALLSEIHDYIDRWHEGNETIPLHEFLGMTKKEYMLFVEDENYLGHIITSHKFGTPLASTIRKEYSLAARSDDAAKARMLQKWLESEGLWD